MEAKAVRRQAATRAVAFTLATAACLFASAGTLRYWNGWVYVGAFALVVLTLTGTVFRDSPDLVEERMSAGKKAKSWDRIFVPLLAVVVPYLTLILAGLDRRFGWTRSITTLESLLALVVMLSANALTFWAMASNRFFSSHVRIQDDRGHTVVTHGPYAYVRHPGYAGAIVYALAWPILLGSLVAFWVSVGNLALWIGRTILEDKTLQRELAGYSEYAERVRYRLVPGVF